MIKISCFIVSKDNKSTMDLVLEKIIPGMPILMSKYTTGEYLPYLYDICTYMPE